MPAPAYLGYGSRSLSCEAEIDSRSTVPAAANGSRCEAGPLSVEWPAQSAYKSRCDAELRSTLVG